MIYVCMKEILVRIRGSAESRMRGRRVLCIQFGCLAFLGLRHLPIPQHII